MRKAGFIPSLGVAAAALAATGVTAFQPTFITLESSAYGPALATAAEALPHTPGMVGVHLEGPFISASDYVRALGEQLTPWIPGDYYVLGTDGMGRSETREALRRHFEVDAESIAIATLSRLSKTGVVEPKDVRNAISELGYDAEKPDPYFA